MEAMPSTTSLPVQAVLFDYGLVLSGPPAPAAWARMRAVFGAEEAPFHAAYWAPRYDYDKGVLGGEAYWHAVARQLGRTPSEDELRNLLEADVDLWTEPNQEMIDWAARLQAAGIRTGILSNLGDAMERGIVARCSWLAAFDHHTFSHRLLIAKPDPAIYAHAAAGLRTEPAHILFVDDREDNIAAARQAGMQAVQYTNHDSFVEAMQAVGLASLLRPATKVAATSA